MFFEKAKVENIKAKILIAGPSGGGKTFSALRFATGLANGKKIGFIDSENDRGKYYANQFNYYINSLKKHSPEDYISAIIEAEKAGIDTLIIDSISHEWKALMEEKDKMPGNSFANFAKITPRHDRFLNTILQSNMHIICTCRAKDKYELSENSRGKMVPKKFGVGLEQRDTVEYEFTTVFHVESDTHTYSVSKDNTGLFSDENTRINEDMGISMHKWCDKGFDPELEEIGTHKAKLLTDFFTNKSLDPNAVLAICHHFFGAKEFKLLKKKDYDKLTAKLKEVKFNLSEVKF